MEKLTISPEWTTHERNTLHALILKKQEDVSEEEVSARGQNHGLAYHQKLQLQARSYYPLLVLLKDDYSTEYLQKNREKFEEFIFI